MKLDELVSKYGEDVAQKLGEVAIIGEPEDQLRAPLESLVTGIAALAGRDLRSLSLVGETSLADLHTRPDYAVSYQGTLVGFIEVKAPGKGSDPTRFRDKHDREQWNKLEALPNLIYTDGQSFSLWHDGERIGDIVTLTGDIGSAGRTLAAPGGLMSLFENFLQWFPIAPRRPKQLAEMTARLCRLLRDETAEQLGQSSPALTSLASDWRDLLFPLATDEQFADGYAQTVTFGLLLARARGIDLDHGIGDAAKTLADSHSLMGTALRVLTQSTESDQTLATSIATLTRVMAVVDWPTISRGDPKAWLYFYEDFLAEYDPALRKATGSYYTPVEVVDAMTRLVDEALESRFGRVEGLAHPDVTVLDPAMGTGTFLLSVLRRIAERTDDQLGSGAVPGALRVALDRLVAFEIQLGPFAVAQLRVLAELAELGLTTVPTKALEFFVTNTLGDPWIEESHLGQIYEPISESRREANRIKKDRPIQVVIGNPPYKEKSKGLGGWVETGDLAASQRAILRDFVPPPEWGLGAHVKHLYNPYVYFWRWATWKVFEHHAPEADQGIVCFITVAGYLNGPGFQQMRSYLRNHADAIWVIDCSPEGHQPAVGSRIFQGVQQPVCITVVVRDGSKPVGDLARVHYRSLRAGSRKQKFDELSAVSLSEGGWAPCPDDTRAPFLPQGSAEWLSYPELDDLLRWSGSGMMPGRTWVIDPDADTLRRRWSRLVSASADEKAALFMEHPTDRPITKALKDNLPGFDDAITRVPIREESGPCPSAAQIGYRSFDRQWVIPDKRLINRPNPSLWRLRSDTQLFMTILHRTAPTSGPAATFTALLPDLDHYKGSFGGRAYPLWLDATSGTPNVVSAVIDQWSVSLGPHVDGESLFAYLAALLAHPAYASQFEEQLRQPGLRLPLTTNPGLFDQALGIGRRVLWLHTFGDRFSDPDADRPADRPRMVVPPKVTKAIPDTKASMPDDLRYDPVAHELHVGLGVVSNVSSAMRNYEVSGVNVIDKWFSYRRKTRERPTIGNKERSALEEIHATTWQHTYTVELIDILNVLGLLIELEPVQADLLQAIIDGPLLTVDELETAGALPVDPTTRKPPPPAAPSAPRLL